MKRPTISRALTGAVLYFCIAITGVSGLAWYGIARMNDATGVIVDHWLPSIERAAAINAAFSDLRVLIRDDIIETSPEGITDLEKKVGEQKAKIDALLAEYGTYVSGPTEKVIYDVLVSNFKDYASQIHGATELHRARRHQDVQVYLKYTLVPRAKLAGQALAKLVAFNRDGARQAGVASADQFQSIMSKLLVAMVVVLAASAATLLYVVRGISNPIGALTGYMAKLASGDSGTEVPFKGRADEIGQMADAVSIFREAVIAKAQEIELDASRRRSEMERIEAERRAEEEANHRLTQATTALAVGLQRVAMGDLDFQLVESFSEEFEPLRMDFNLSIRQLSDALGSIAHSVISMENSTREIANGAGDLSLRTEKQASSLEETAAALDQITSNVTNSTRKTEEAKAISWKADQSAAASVLVVTEAERAMQRIEASSTEIANIIGVIDEIAFQTNLLALNAGVEAARAGQGGKGFAVVAQEVRELAQRSATAAKEIKGLIQNSTREVENGVKLVRNTGEALKTIGSFIADINRHMDDIAVSAREQATGLSEVNTAVNQMDQVTQSNAAMVEQSTAAVDALSGEAIRLSELVAQFRLPDEGRTQSPALRQVAGAMADVANAAAARDGRSNGSQGRRATSS